MRGGAGLALALALPALGLAQEGGLWAREVRGEVGAAQVERLKVLSPGKVVVRPAPGDAARVRYTWKYKVASRGENPRVQEAVGNGWCVLNAGAGGVVQSELHVEAPARLRQVLVEVGMGQVSVKGMRGEVQVSAGAGNLEMDEIEGSVSVRTGGGAMTFGRIGGSLRCLSGGGTIRADRVGGDAVLETAGGEIWLNQAGGTVRASTAGNIAVGRAGGMVSAHSAGGMIEVEEAGGLVTAETAAGPIVVGRARGVRAETANGWIRMRAIAGVVRASTNAGSIELGLAAGARQGASFLASGRGDITVRIPARMGLNVKALNESRNWYSRVVSEFPEVRTQAPAGGLGRAVLAEGAIQGGGAALLVSVGNGSLYLKRAR